MMKLEVVIDIHEVLIKKYGGSSGIRDQAALESAISRPYQTFDGTELYKSSAEKAAAIIESIIKNHPFVDGNKRTGYILMQVILQKDGKKIQASEDEKYEFVIDIAAGQSEYNRIRAWIEDRIKE